MRILGRGKTAQALKEIYKNAKMYDDENQEEFDINSDDLTIISPGFAPHHYLVKNTKNPTSDYDLFLSDDFMPPFSIWISGTNGKTTTTSMLYHLLKDKGFLCGGNIGTPLALFFTDETKNGQKQKNLILETSSFTLHYTNKAKPNIYILLPISSDHISWHGSFKEYEKSKLKPLDNLIKSDIAIIPKIYENYPTLGHKICYEDTKSLEKIFNIQKDKINFKEPFLIDAMLCLAVTKILFDEVNYDKINNFIQDPHKLEEFFDKDKKLWIDDSKATNIDATIKALKNYKDKKIFLILGGDDKGINLNPLFQELKNYDIKIFAIGSNSSKLDKLSLKYNQNCTISNSLENAVNSIKKDINFVAKTSVGLLSPCASSLDFYSSYKQRGEEFKKLVNSDDKS